MTMDIMQNQRQVTAAHVFPKVCVRHHRLVLWLRTFLLRQDEPLFSADGSVFYTILPAKQGARGEFHHIAGLSAQVS